MNAMAQDDFFSAGFDPGSSSSVTGIQPARSDIADPFETLVRGMR
jgi:hypothetical protein